MKRASRVVLLMTGALRLIYCTANTLCVSICAGMGVVQKKGGRAHEMIQRWERLEGSELVGVREQAVLREA